LGNAGYRSNRQDGWCKRARTWMHLENFQIGVGTEPR
jgi:hypothetical protein